MESAIASDVVTTVDAFVINASHFGKITSVVRFNKRLAEIAVGRPEETARYSARVEVNACNDATVINFLRPG